MTASGIRRTHVFRWLLLPAFCLTSAFSCLLLRRDAAPPADLQPEPLLEPVGMAHFRATIANPADETQRVRFEFTNQRAETVTVDRVQTSCPSVIPEVSPRTVPPGGHVFVRATVVVPEDGHGRGMFRLFDPAGRLLARPTYDIDHPMRYGLVVSPERISVSSGRTASVAFDLRFRTRGAAPVAGVIVEDMVGVRVRFPADLQWRRLRETGAFCASTTAEVTPIAPGDLDRQFSISLKVAGESLKTRVAVDVR